MHVRPTPRLGGIAMFFGVVFAIGVASLLPNFSIIFSEPLKVAGLLLAARSSSSWSGSPTTSGTWTGPRSSPGKLSRREYLPWSGIQIYTLPILRGVTQFPPTISLIVTVIAVVLVMNAINFIDGLDGLVAGIAIITNGVFFVYSYILVINAGSTQYYNLASPVSAILIGACVGFPAAQFSSGETVYGGRRGAFGHGRAHGDLSRHRDRWRWIRKHGVAANCCQHSFPILLPFAVLVIPLLDFGLAVLRRLRAGQSPFTADRKHLHHRLLDIGHGHLGAVLIFYGWTTVFALGGLSFMFLPTMWSVILIGAGVLACAFVTFSPMFRRAGSAAKAALVKGEQ